MLPRAKAIAQVRRRPLARDKSVAAVMMPVLLRIELSPALTEVSRRFIYNTILYTSKDGKEVLMHILIVRNNSNSKATDASLLLAAYLNSQNISYIILDSAELFRKDETPVHEQHADKTFELAVVLGGDGTILRTARLVANSDIPILGINFGRLGFLANSSEDGVVAIVAAALAGDVVRERRSNLRIDVCCAGDDTDSFPPIDDCEEGSGKYLSEGTFCKGSYFALNELALTRGTTGQIIDFQLKIDDVSIADMRGDGLVVATATGSTAYALSAGGPLVAPGYDGLVVVPIAPHTLHSRAIVTSGSDVVEIDLTSTQSEHEATLAADGGILEFDATPTKILVRKGSKPSILLHYKKEGFYEHAAKVFF